MISHYLKSKVAKGKISLFKLIAAIWFGLVDLNPHPPNEENTPI
jgi:hypothetical protein